MNHRTRSVRLSTGVRLEYAEHGDPRGVPLVLLHGYSDSLHSFAPLMRHLPPSLRVVAPSQRGHGDSDRPAAGYGPEVFASDAVALLDALGIDRAVVLGHSGGSYAAQYVAIGAPERTLGLVLVGAFRSMRDIEGVDGLREAVGGLGDPVDPGFVRDFQASTLTRPVPPGFFATIVSESRKLPAAVWRAYLEDSLAAEVPTERGPVVAPTLILWGDRDAYARRADQEALADVIPDAELVVYEGTGHVPHWEEPARAAADVAVFARRVAADAEPARRPVLAG